jgi:hypothetical protein
MINILLTTLLGVLSAHQDRAKGVVDARELNEAKKRFSDALSGFIDYRIRLAFEQRRKTQSQEMIAVADSINASVKATATTIKSIAALNSAPPPPPPEDVNNPEAMHKWREIYTEWYEKKRKQGVSIE